MSVSINLQNINTVSIELGSRSYPIWIGPGVLDQPLCAEFSDFAGSTAVVVSNTTVGPLYAARLQAALQAAGHARVLCLLLPDGETYKTWETLHTVFDFLLSHACDRRTVLYALGGGVVGDITGFAAACFMRGIPFVQVPTTLLAQVDSSVGGKTGINHPLGKNMLGAFYQPRAVLADLGSLNSLAMRELRAGLAEVIKYGCMWDAGFFDWLEQHLDALLAREPQALAHAVQRCCQAKAQVVSADEREQAGPRALLNFGHTFGHAIEAGLGFGTWLHGEAVAAGMVMATHLSVALGLLDAQFLPRLIALLQRAGLPVAGPPLGADEYLRHMRLDKKALAGDIRFVLLHAPGRAVLQTAPTDKVRATIDACCSPPSRAEG